MCDEKETSYATPLYDALPIEIKLFVDEISEMKVQLDLVRYYEMSEKKGLKDFAMLMEGMFIDYDSAECRERYAEKLNTLYDTFKHTRT